MRRRMIKCKDSEGGSIYKLSSPVIFDGSNNIDTGIHLYRDYADFTVFADFTFNKNNQIEFSYSGATIAACMYEINPWPGFTLRYIVDSGLTLIFGDSPAYNVKIPDGLCNCKVCFSVKNKRCESAYFKIGDAEPEKKEVVDTSPQNNIEQAILTLGSYRTPDGAYGRYWIGTMHEFIVYNRTLSEDEINKLF